MKGWKWNRFNFAARYFEIGQADDRGLWSENKKGKMRSWEVCA